MPCRLPSIDQSTCPETAPLPLRTVALSVVRSFSARSNVIDVLSRETEETASAGRTLETLTAIVLESSVPTTCAVISALPADIPLTVALFPSGSTTAMPGALVVQSTELPSETGRTAALTVCSCPTDSCSVAGLTERDEADVSAVIVPTMTLVFASTFSTVAVMTAVPAFLGETAIVFAPASHASTPSGSSTVHATWRDSSLLSAVYAPAVMV